LPTQSCTAGRSEDPQHRYWLLAIDVDGTLLNSANELSDGAEDALWEARRRGVRVCLVSGRAKISLMPVLDLLGMDEPFVASGGAYIEDPQSGEIIDHQCLDWEDAAAIVRIARAVDASVFFENPDRLFGELKPRHAHLTHGVDPATVVFLQDLLNDNQESPTKISVIGEPELVAQAERKIRAYNPTLHAVYPFITCLDVSRPGVHKGTAVQRLASYLAVPLDQVVAIGDQDNDISMFQVAGLSAAVGNAPSHVRAAADVVAPTNDEGGVAWVLWNLVLNGTRAK
jgi:Cof subfamily protein (haloacid dehalogenase superfamily)